MKFWDNASNASLQMTAKIILRRARMVKPGIKVCGDFLANNSIFCYFLRSAQFMEWNQFGNKFQKNGPKNLAGIKTKSLVIFNRIYKALSVSAGEATHLCLLYVLLECRPRWSLIEHPPQYGPKFCM